MNSLINKYGDNIKIFLFELEQESEIVNAEIFLINRLQPIWNRQKTQRGDNMPMPFIDWDNNGKIDPTDIAISIMMDDENENKNDNNVPPPEPKHKNERGCLTSIITMVGFVSIAIISLIK